MSSTGVGGMGGGTGGATTSSTTSGSTGGALGGSGGAMGGSGGGCSDACVINSDCPAETPYCAGPNGCKSCFGMCDSSQCTGFNTCVSDADCNASPNAKCVCGPDNCTMCVLSNPGSPVGFPEELANGVWLIGWYGGLDHFSWFKFTFQTDLEGTFDMLDPFGVTLVPLYQCQGKGLFTVNVGTATLHLTLPASCMLPVQHYTFTAFLPPDTFPPHATLVATITAQQGQLAGYQHSADFCNAQFTACGDPFMP